MKSLFVAPIMLMSWACSAQEPPPVVRSMSENVKPGHHVLSKDDVTKDQRDFVDKATKRRSDYLIVQVAPAYLSQLNEIDLKNWLVRHQHEAQVKVGDAGLLGRFKEGPNRVNFVFGEGNKATAMFTVWKMEADGATVVTLAENQNQKIGSVPATLSLARADKSAYGLWKVFAVDTGIAYEFVVEDRLSSDGTPQLQPSEVMVTVNKLVDAFKSRSLSE